MQDSRGRELKQGDLVIVPRRNSRAGRANLTVGIYIGKSARYIKKNIHNKEVLDYSTPTFCYIIENPTEEELAIKHRILELLR